VTQRAVQRLPRLVLWLFCVAYVLPGVFDRDPWKNADVTAFGYMMSLVRGDSAWLHPSIGGLGSDGSALPYWLGAASIELLGSWMDPALAARLPFVCMLAAALFLTWHACFHLALTDEAQPLPFAFGGEASRPDYARTMADASVLALIAPLGLLQLGHETTPELVQLAAVTLLLYGLASTRHRGWGSALAVLISLPALAASGAATTALWMGAVALVLLWRSSHASSRALLPWLGVALLGTIGVAFAVGAWADRLSDVKHALGMPKLLAWFTWPVWPLVGWTLWRWRRQLGQHHLLTPLAVALVSIGASTAMGASDRALMLALPALAILAAFSLPTLKRSVSAVVDWFSVFFFSIAALVIWVIYVSVQTGVPAQPAINISRLAPGFEHHFKPIAFVFAAAGSVAWIWLVRWRTSQHRPVLWKSLVLPAGGVALSWLLLMTLWLPLLDYARSYRPLMRQIAQVIPAKACIVGPELAPSQLAALEAHGNWQVTTDTDRSGCNWLVISRAESVNGAIPDANRVIPRGWVYVTKQRRPTDRNEVFYVYRRATAKPSTD
jgi:hypothetical protein